MTEKTWQALASAAAKRHLSLVSDPTSTVETMDDTKKGPWFGAMYDGKCSSCEDKIYEGDRIRADGEGGYECEQCEQDAVADARTFEEAPYVKELRNAVGSLGLEEQQELYSAVGPIGIASPSECKVLVALPTPDEFMDPTTPAPNLNVSGQPEAPRDYLGRYTIKDPATGDFRWSKGGKKQGITRVTTFNKAAGNSKAINDWNRRNVVIGAALRGDLVIKARGMTHDLNKNDLDRIAGELETAAGSKVASSIGTDVHEITERIDAGVLKPEDAPVQYQAQLKLYVEELARAGFEPVPGMIERVTAITEFGGVAGTFDRTYYHRPSDQYVIGDVKTGKTMQYSIDETQCQEWIYAHGVNQNGVYDLNTDTWIPPGAKNISETVGLIIHMPVQGPDAGKVMLLKADLVKGKAYAELCASVRGWPKSKVVPWSWEPETAAEAAPVRHWAKEFGAVTSRAQAAALYAELVADGASQEGLATMAMIGLAALRRQGLTP